MPANTSHVVPSGFCVGWWSEPSPGISVGTFAATSRLEPAAPVRPGRFTLGPLVVTEMQRAFALLDRLPRPPRKQSLERFREAFVERHGEARDVPLSTVFDPETGLGFGPTPGHTARRSPTPDWLVDRVRTALDRDDFELDLDEHELGAPDSTDLLPPLPNAFHALVRLAAPSPEAIDRGDFQLWFRGLAGPSGARLLGPLCSADETLRHHVEAHLRQEEALDPETIHAEIVHLCEGEPGTVPAHPRLREHEIPFLARASTNEEHQIPLNDLHLRVESERIVLTSARLGRRVAPRSSTDHYFGGSPHAVARFLGAVQSDGVLEGWCWDWGTLAAEPFLPRVRCGRLVLAPARWRIPDCEITALARLADADRRIAVERWRTERRLPRWISPGDLVPEPPVDLDDPLSVNALLARPRRGAAILLSESFPQPEGLWAHSPNGSFVDDLIVPFVRATMP